ncbi:MAG: DUF2334 domain-containing protein [Burkholderiales bacterium]|jgi:hypothetical protein
MRRPDAAPPAVAIAVHDVSPATWRECRELLAMLDDAGARPVSLLVIPHYHYHSQVLRDRAFVRALDARLARGDEAVLHGYFHVDDASPPRTPGAWLARRMLTSSEGEFAALDRHAAVWRIARGVEMFRILGWPLAGFVPPAWMMSAGARAALAQCEHRFDYATIRTGFFHLPEWRFERTANLWYSPGTTLRRAISRAAIRTESWRARRTPLLRISLHPQDVRVPGVLRHWRRLIGDALATRAPVTKQAWTRRFREPEERTPLSGATRYAVEAPDVAPANSAS